MTQKILLFVIQQQSYECIALFNYVDAEYDP